MWEKEEKYIYKNNKQKNEKKKTCGYSTFPTPFRVMLMLHELIN